jgi:hypothetical protein
VCSSCWRPSRRSAKRLRGCVRVSPLRLSCGRGSCVYRHGACVTADVVIGIRVVMAAPRGSCRRTASS